MIYSLEKIIKKEKKWPHLNEPCTKDLILLQHKGEAL